MSTLHLVNSHRGLEACLTRLKSGDVVVLMHDACSATLPRCPSYRLDEHARARGLPETDSDIDYADLVALTEKCQPIVTWR